MPSANTISKPSWFHYHIEHEWTAPRDLEHLKAAPSLKAGHSYSGEKMIYASSAEHALEQFHRFMQQSHESDHLKRVFRPKLSPDAYVVLGLRIYYKDATQVERKQEFDLPPDRANPDVRKMKRVRAEEPTTEMPFMTEVEVKEK